MFRVIQVAAIALIIKNIQCGVVSKPGVYCAINCSVEVDPVCGSDGVTYPNICILGKASCLKKNNVTLYRRGMCGEPVSPSPGKGSYCDINCPFEEVLVCGSDGRTYLNICRLYKASCLKNNNITLNHKGMCAQPENCEKDQFKCKNGQCIPGIERCQLTNYGEGCADGSHLHDCVDEYPWELEEECSADEFKCKHGGCIPLRARCQIPSRESETCADGSHFDNCGFYCELMLHGCPDAIEPVCGNNGKTYKNHCYLLSGNCGNQFQNITLESRGLCGESSPCGASEFECANGQCIPDWQTYEYFHPATGDGCVDGSHNAMERHLYAERTVPDWLTSADATH